MLIDLALVMPVYNEEECIAGVVKSWLYVLSELNINFRVIILNDGSRDKTQKAIDFFSNHDCVEIINKKNTGHGPTILLGYKKAIKIAKWVFQCDSDDEIKSEYFSSLWEKRKEFDALFGIRKGRNLSLSRKLITAFSRLTVRLVFSKGVTDVNIPYRLIRSKILKQIVYQIPGNTFAPNIIISGMLSETDVRIYEESVPHESRRTGEVSIAGLKLLKSSVKSFWQTLSYHPAIKDVDGRNILMRHTSNNR